MLGWKKLNNSIRNMQFDILTIFPESFSYLRQSIIGKAADQGLINIKIHNLRDWATDTHRTIDDKPFGGGAGMLFKVEVIYKALKALGVYPKRDPKTKVILTLASGEIWTQNLVKKFTQEFNRLVIICGRYEGVDYRVNKHLIDYEISIGEYILSGGELPAMAILDSLSRQIPEVLGSEESLKEESFEESMKKEYPQYTRPAQFLTEEGESWDVPEVLLSGDHAKITDWKKDNSI